MSLDEMAAKAFGISSFTTVGHLLHINLKDHLLQQKHEIGRALLNKNPRALAVVNKINTIDNQYRNFEIEVIAKREGCEMTDEELMIVEVNENKCRFQLDFSKVYWNSRLCTEHERIIAKLHKPCDIVFDLFAGVGPFSVPAAKAKCQTYANDLNPESVAWLGKNIARNKVKTEHIRVFHMDAADFIQKRMKKLLVQEYKRYEDEELATKPTIHIIMNLPALAPTFLPHFVGLFKDDTKTTVNSRSLLDTFRDHSLEHIVYCYCFLKGLFDDPRAELKRIVEEHIGRELNDDQFVGAFRVRNVAPYKDMYRVEIRLDEQILFDVKSIVGIMRNANGRTSLNGTSKKVTIKTPPGKRTHDESPDTSGSEASDTKRTKLNDYCSIM